MLHATPRSGQPLAKQGADPHQRPQAVVGKLGSTRRDLRTCDSCCSKLHILEEPPEGCWCRFCWWSGCSAIVRRSTLARVCGARPPAAVVCATAASLRRCLPPAKQNYVLAQKFVEW